MDVRCTRADGIIQIRGGKYLKITIGIIILLLLNSVTDWKIKKVWMPSVWIALPYIIYCLWDMGKPLGMHLLAGIVVGMSVILISVLTEGQIGRGDGAVMGVLMLAMDFWQGVACLFISMVYVFGAAVLCVVFFHRKRDYRIPFVPFLLMGYMTWLVSRVFG